MADVTEGLLAAVPDEPRDAGPPWLLGLRREAAASLREQGFPGRKHEAWRFTSVREVVDTSFRSAEPGDAADVVGWVDERLGDDGTWRLVLADGRPVIDAAGAAPPGVTVRSLAEVLRDEPALVEHVLGKLAPAEHFAALSSALFEDGAVVVLDGPVERPVHLVHVATASDEPTAAYPRVVVIAKSGSAGTLVESFLDQGSAAAHLTNAVELDRDAFYGSRVVALGGALSRLELTARFTGPGSEVELDGVYHVDGKDHVDHQILVDHRSGRCTSHVRYRGLLDGKGHAVFNAVGVVERDAQQSSVHQENRNLLLSDDATIDTKPHLEIDADDIQASHGAAVGAVDDAQLFYLRSRAIPEAQARDLLTFAFVRELLERIPSPALVKRTSDAVLARLPHGRLLDEMNGDESAEVSS